MLCCVVLCCVVLCCVVLCCVVLCCVVLCCVVLCCVVLCRWSVCSIQIWWTISTHDLAFDARHRRNSWDNASGSAASWFNSVTYFFTLATSSPAPAAGGVRCSEASTRSASNRCSPSLNSCSNLARSSCAFRNASSASDNLFLALDKLGTNVDSHADGARGRLLLCLLESVAQHLGLGTVVVSQCVHCRMQTHNSLLSGWRDLQLSSTNLWNRSLRLGTSLVGLLLISVLLLVLSTTTRRLGPSHHGRGPRITCNHPFGTSNVLHPLRGINSHGSHGRKKTALDLVFPCAKMAR